MGKKSSSIIDLRQPQTKSIGENTTQYQERDITAEFSPLDTFELPLEGEEIIIQEQITYTIPPQEQLHITFIPQSAKRYTSKKKIQKIKPILRYTISSKTIYASRASLGIFLSLCLIMVISVPSLRMINKGIRVKDNLTLQAAASEKLLTKTDANSIQGLATSLTEISNGLNKSAGDISAIQGNLSGLLSILPGLSVIQDSSDLTENISEVIALSGELSEAIEPFINQDINPFDTSKSVTLVDGVKNIQEINKKLVPALDKLDKSLNNLPLNLIPGNKGDILRQLHTDIPKLQKVLEGSDQYVNIFLNFVGSDRLKRYVFIFQNNQELRATGGFIGSFGLMNLDKGVVESLDIQEIYNPDGQLLKQILAPGPLQELTPRWYLRDSNWFADFPTSAQKIISFYEKTGGVTPDGVISLTPTVIERLLTITGPIELDNYGVTVNADNFVKITQYQTGIAYDKEINKPKQFIADLAPILINKLLSADSTQYQKIIEALNNSFQEKHILLYFLDPTLQNIVTDNNLGGQLYITNKDYLSVVHTNIGGFKTDGVIEDSMQINTKVQDNGTIINKVTINRNHKGGDSEYEWWNKDNINYMRMYIPKNARILHSEGYTDREEKVPPAGTASFDQDLDLAAVNSTLVHNEDWDIDVFEESGKSVIGGWIITRPKETSQIMVEYELPFKVEKGDMYSLILQKQSGSIGVRYQYNLELPPKWKSGWNNSSFDLQKTDSGYNVTNGILRTDEFIGLEIK
jgi:hypothetical protein